MLATASIRPLNHQLHASNLLHQFASTSNFRHIITRVDLLQVFVPTQISDKCVYKWDYVCHEQNFWPTSIVPWFSVFTAVFNCLNLPCPLLSMNSQTIYLPVLVIDISHDIGKMKLASICYISPWQKLWQNPYR